MPTALGRSTPAPSGRRFSRRRALALGGVGAATVVGAVTATDLASGGQVRKALRSPAPAAVSPTPTASPTPPAFTVLTNRPGQAAGDLFLTDMGDTPGTVIADPQGSVLWSTSGAKSYADLRLQTYQGQPVITWWESNSTGLAAYAEGRDMVTDLEHTKITTVGPHAGVSPDEHEFMITPRGTALIVSYVETRADLRKHGGSKHGRVMNGVVEEIDLATGRVLLHWESLDHVDLGESHAGVPDNADEPWDYFHVNSVKPTSDGNLVVSARHTWGVYKINRDTGKIIWRFGGRRSDFDLPRASRFAWQHDAEFEAPNQLRLFDNASDGTVKTHDHSRVLWFALDPGRGRAELRRSLVHPDRVQADAMGNAQRLDNGNVLVGWGTARRVTEFSPDGTMIFDAQLPAVSYRAYRHVWR